MKEKGDAETRSQSCCNLFTTRCRKGVPQSLHVFLLIKKKKKKISISMVIFFLVRKPIAHVLLMTAQRVFWSFQKRDLRHRKVKQRTPQTDLLVNIIQIRKQAVSFVLEIDNLLPKFTEKYQGPRITKEQNWSFYSTRHQDLL